MNQDPIGLDGCDNLYWFAPNVQGWVDFLGLAKKHPSARRPGDYRTYDMDPHGRLSPQANRAPGHFNKKDDDRGAITPYNSNRMGKTKYKRL